MQGNNTRRKKEADKLNTKANIVLSLNPLQSSFDQFHLQLANETLPSPSPFPLISDENMEATFQLLTVLHDSLIFGPTIARLDGQGIGTTGVVIEPQAEFN